LFNLGIKDKVSKWFNPDATTADLGDRMEAYYDDKLKVWVFPGDDPAEIAKPIGPPPTTIVATPPSSGKDLDDKGASRENVDPLAAMMAPPQRGPAALSRSRGAKSSIRPSPASMPIMFPPGMTIPGGSNNNTAAALPSVTNFSVFIPHPATVLQDNVKVETQETTFDNATSAE
jgi:hypothetical protein